MTTLERWLFDAGSRLARLESVLPVTLPGSLTGRLVVAVVVVGMFAPAVALTLFSGPVASTGFVALTAALLCVMVAARLQYELVGARNRIRASESGPSPNQPEEAALEELAALEVAADRRAEELESRVRRTETDRETAIETLEIHRRGIEEAAESVTDCIEDAASGSYTRRASPDLPPEAPEAFEELAAALDDLLEEYEETLFNAASFAETVEAASIDAADSHETLFDRGDALGEELDRLGDRLDRQRRSIERVAETAETVPDVFEEIEVEAETAESAFETLLTAGADAETSLETTAAELEAVRPLAERSSREVEHVRDAAGELTDRLESFEALSEQVGLLALNATLHAERAASGGRAEPDRFRTLAGEALSLADTIEVQIRACQELADAVVAASDRADAAIADIDEQVVVASEQSAGASADIATLVESAESAGEAVRSVRRRADRGDTTASHAAGLADRALGATDRSLELHETATERAVAVKASAADLEVALGTVRSQAEFLGAELDDVATADVDSVRRRRTATQDH